MTLPFGKYKGTKVKHMTSPEQVSYLQWLYQVAPNKLKEEILKHLNNGKTTTTF